MKRKYILSLSLILIFSCLFSVYTTANNDKRDWFYKRKGEDTPDFPPDADFVKAHGGYYVGDKGDKKLYITFDAGYENGNIEKILDILKEENVPCAFFILKNLVLKNPELIKRMANEGHLVCNHTKNHKDMTSLTEEEMRLNLEFLETLCYEKTGVKMAKYFRFPEGRYSEDTLLTAEKNGYKTIFWSLSHADWDNSAQPEPTRATRLLLENTHDGAVILFHPTSETNVKILKTLISEWRKMGYTFGTLDELTK